MAVRRRRSTSLCALKRRRVAKFIEFAAGRRVALRELVPPPTFVDAAACDGTQQPVVRLLSHLSRRSDVDACAQAARRRPRARRSQHARVCFHGPVVLRATATSSPSRAPQVRAYREHSLRYLFSLKQLPLGRAAMAYGLLRFPRMPEAQVRVWRRRLVLALIVARAQQRRTALDGFVAADVDLSAVPFADKTREQQRQAKLTRVVRNDDDGDDADENDDDNDDVGHDDIDDADDANDDATPATSTSASTTPTVNKKRPRGFATESLSMMSVGHRFLRLTERLARAS